MVLICLRISIIFRNKLEIVPTWFLLSQNFVCYVHFCVDPQQARASLSVAAFTILSPRGFPAVFILSCDIFLDLGFPLAYFTFCHILSFL